jgi:hypothetical protein
MSPQFVDFDGDGRLDIVAGIFDGSPHLVRGTEKGWAKPEQILDNTGDRIVLNAFWNFDTKKWDATNKFDAPGRVADDSRAAEAHAIAALAMDLDGDGDLDLLLGDHRSGNVYRRINEGTAQKPAFAVVNELVLADGKPIDVPGTVATMRLVDWNGDGLQDLACGGMGDAFGDGEGGGVHLFPNVGTAKAPAFGAMVTLLARSDKKAAEPVRPDSGIYMDFADHDGDGDLDMVVGGYSHWQPKRAELTAEQKARVAELRAGIAAAEQERKAVYDAIEQQLQGLDEAKAKAKRDELLAAKKEQVSALGKKRQALHKELEPLAPGMKRESFVWLYENVAAAKPAAPAK